MPPISIDGTDVSAISIDGTDVTEVTADGDVVWTATAMVDNFEDSPDGVYGQLTDFYSGDTGSFSRNTNSPVAEGSYSLKVTTSGTNSIITSADGGGLNYYPEAGDTIRWNFYWSGGGDWPNLDLRFAVSGSSNYEMSLNRSNQWVRIYKDSSDVLAEDTSPNLPDAEILEGEFNWETNGNLTLTVWDSNDNQISQVSANDTSYTDGGIEISMGQDGQTVMLDNIRTV